MGLDESLAVHQTITLVDLQIDAQNSCLFTYNKFIKTLYVFPAHNYDVDLLKMSRVMLETCTGF